MKKRKIKLEDEKWVAKLKKRQEEIRKDRDINQVQSRFYHKFTPENCTFEQYNSIPQTLKEPKKLDWRVFGYDFNSDKIEIVNIFDYNWPFLGMLYKANKEAGDDFSVFSVGVKNALMHEYWCRCQYEIYIKGGYDHVLPEEIDRLVEEKKNKDYARYSVNTAERTEKIDVYTQVIMNWEPFIKYLWENRKLISKFKKEYKNYYKK